MSMKVSASPEVSRMPGVAREKARAASSRRKASSCASMTARTARASSDGTASWAAARCGAKARSSAPRKRVIISDAEQLLERSRCRADRLRIGALLGLVLRGGKAVAGAAVDLVLEGDLRTAQLLDQAVDRRERKAHVLGAVQDQEHALGVRRPSRRAVAERAVYRDVGSERDRKSTRLNSSHVAISYAVFCLKKKKSDSWRFLSYKKLNCKQFQVVVLRLV